MVRSAKITGSRVRTFNSILTSGFCPTAPTGSAFHRENIVTTPNTAIARKDIRQPMVCPTHVAKGTPPILAIVSPMNMIATALACLCAGTTLAATTEPIPKKAP